jgi:membrane-associated phospholipid phosphatase
LSILQRYPVRPRCVCVCVCASECIGGGPLCFYCSHHFISTADFLVKVSVWLPILIILTSPWWRNLLCCNNKSSPSSSGTAWTDRLLQWQVQGRLCAFFTVVGLSEGSTQLIKFMVQRRRPNFYALCGFDVHRQVCTGSMKAIRDANFSFPSGHSSLSMCAMSFLVWMFLGMLLSTLSNKRKLVPSATEWWKPTRLECLQCSALLVTVLPLSWAVFVGATRLVDHWHHPADVLAGLLLGGITGTIGYHLWFPPIWNSTFLGPTYPWSVHVLYESSPASASMEMAPRTE